MGLMDFLKERGFIADEDTTKKSESTIAKNNSEQTVLPVFFPLSDPQVNAAADSSGDPSFVSPLPQQQKPGNQLDPSFVKFFEEELSKANLPGPDYFEFRQLLTKTQQKMEAKGNAAPEVVLQAVLMSFEAQDISPNKLIDAANQYKLILKQKKDDFVKGAEAEKNNQLQKRQSVLKTHDENIKKIMSQIQDLELQKRQLEESLNKEKTQLDVNKTLGQEGIAKIEKAQRLIDVAYTYIQSGIDNDIHRLEHV